tara:strand:+ start:323 stop:1597 length:1275 start_codon:yes stop_codon:yes gene_type:complete
MGIHRGPNTVKDGLVFGYDTGYGVADNSTATRFYPGKPATNLITSGLPGYFGSGGETLYQKTLNNFTSNSGVFQRNFVNNPATSSSQPNNNAGLYKNFTSAALSSNTEYVLVSFDFYLITPYVRYDNSGTGLNGYMGISYTDGTGQGIGWNTSLNTPNSGDDWNNNSAYVGQWRKIALYVQVNSAKTPASISSMYIYNDKTVTGEGIFTNFIITEHATIPVSPVLYTESSRSSTASLIDLKRTASIDVSNVSFDSTGQPTFDGTDDAIQLSSSVFNKSGSNPITVECVTKPGRLSGQYQDIVVNRSNSAYNWMLYQHTNDGSIQLHGGSQYKSTYVPVVGNYIHVVATVDASNNMVLYINGEVKQTVSSYAYASGQPGALSIGRFGTSSEPYLGDISVAKIYDTALSATQVAQNYKAYKNRFNL